VALASFDDAWRAHNLAVVTQFHLMLTLLVFLALWYGAFLVATYLDHSVDSCNELGNTHSPWVTNLRIIGLTAGIAAGVAVGGLWLMT
jgi:hypothetical protein